MTTGLLAGLTDLATGLAATTARFVADVLTADDLLTGFADLAGLVTGLLAGLDDLATGLAATAARFAADALAADDLLTGLATGLLAGLDGLATGLAATAARFAADALAAVGDLPEPVAARLTFERLDATVGFLATTARTAFFLVAFGFFTAFFGAGLATIFLTFLTVFAAAA